MKRYKLMWIILRHEIPYTKLLLADEYAKFFDLILLVPKTETNLERLKNSAFRIYFVEYTKKSDLYTNLFKEMKDINLVEDPDLILIVMFRLSWLVPLFVDRRKIVLEFQHFDVAKNNLRRFFWNFKNFIDLILFKNVTYAMDVMPKWLLKLNKGIHKFSEYSRDLSKKPKMFNDLHLLYIGSLGGRNVKDTLIGFKKFIDSFEEFKYIRYDVIGSGTKDVVDSFTNCIEELNLKSNVFYHGRLSDEEIKPYFDNCNIGVAYVPITKYYSNNTPSKTVEYLIAGMAIIATKTKANKRYIHKNNGVLINDSSEDFYKGLIEISQRMFSFNSKEIRKEYVHLSNYNSILQDKIEYFIKVIKNND